MPKTEIVIEMVKIVFDGCWFRGDFAQILLSIAHKISISSAILDEKLDLNDYSF